MKPRLSLLLAIATLVTWVGPVSAQGPREGDGVRFGISLGGISTVSATVEFFRDARSIDVSLGTWAFHEVSMSVVARQYFGAGSAKPVVGAGLWVVGAGGPGTERTGWAVVIRAPIGVDWAVASQHAMGFFLNVDRGLFVRRANPADDLPLNRRLVPLPEVYYRYTR